MKKTNLPIFPFTAIVGQEEMKLALELNVIDPKIGGVMIMGDRGTGKSTTIRDFVRMAFNYIGVELEFSGQGINETAKIKSCSSSDFQLKLGKEVLSID